MPLAYRWGVSPAYLRSPICTGRPARNTHRGSSGKGPIPHVPTVLTVRLGSGSMHTTWVLGPDPCTSTLWQSDSRETTLLLGASASTSGKWA